MASVKVAPHVVEAATVDAGARLAGFGGQPLVWVAPFIAGRVGVVVKESRRARPRASGSRRASGPRSRASARRIVDIVYVDDDDEAVEAALAAVHPAARPADLVLTAGSASTDPADAFFVAIEALGGRVVRRGVPAHPGSMLWLARVGRTAILGLPTCGAYSKATAADLLLPRLLSGEPASERTVAKLGHGGILTAVAALPLPAVCAGARRPRRLARASIAR